MKIAILEDNQDELKELLDVLALNDNSKDEITCFDNGKQFLSSVKAGVSFELAFIDIYVLNENGLDIAREVQTMAPNIEIVFTTTSLDHAITAFDLNALHYLVKPVTKEKVDEVFIRYQAKNSRKRPVIIIKDGHQHRTLFLDQIDYLQSDNHMIDIYLSDGKMLSIYANIKDLEKDLGDTFIKLQRGIIVNMAFIEKMDSKECLLQNGEKVMLSRRNKSAIREVYENYVFKCLEKRGNEHG